MQKAFSQQKRLFLFTLRRTFRQRNFMQIKSYLSLVKFSHTIFALPFALIGFFVSLQRYGNGAINPRLLLLVLACMVTARNAAMAFNRWADQKYDALNPRTATREIPYMFCSADQPTVLCPISCGTPRSVWIQPDQKILLALSPILRLRFVTGSCWRLSGSLQSL